VKQIVEAAELKGEVNVKDAKAMDELVAETLLQDEHSAGLHCRYLRYMNRISVNETVETYAEEYPDGWLDYEACEGRLGRGGRCEVAKCFWSVLQKLIIIVTSIAHGIPIGNKWLQPCLLLPRVLLLHYYGESKENPQQETEGQTRAKLAFK
jgi:hypothetical protein